MGAKTDGSDTDSVTGLVQGPGRVISGAEEPMSDEEEDDDDRFSFTTTASAAKILAESDKTKDSSKYVLYHYCCYWYIYFDLFAYLAKAIIHFLILVNVW